MEQRERDPRRAAVAKEVRWQGGACATLGSPLYAALLDHVESGGAAWRVLEPVAGWSRESAYVLRLMGAVHRLVLAGDAPALESHFLPGGDGAAAWPALRDLLEERAGQLRGTLLQRPVQTNEVGRCAALAPAILWAARGLPIRLLEIGASAGLNLRFDHYRYDDLWGPSDSPVQLIGRYEGDPPPFPAQPVEVVERRGCDREPVDAMTEEGRLTLLSFVWPDQAERVRLLRGALASAASMPVALDREPAGAWLERVLSEDSPGGVATVVFHSIVWNYLDESEQQHIEAALSRAGATATSETPLAWVRMEPAHWGRSRGPEVRARTWPDGGDRLVANAGYHGSPVRWVARRAAGPARAHGASGT